jgi:NADPH2:quinone reductase
VCRGRLFDESGGRPVEKFAEELVLVGGEPVGEGAFEDDMRGQSLITYNSNLASQTHPGRLADSAARAMSLGADGSVRVDITAEYELLDIETAIANLAGGRTRGKSIVRVG